jgi:spore maturation protein SpmA
MTLNYIWIFFFLAAFAVATIKLIFTGDTQVFSSIVDAIFSRAKMGFELSLGLTGVLALWMGIMKIGEKGGVLVILAKAVSPLFNRIFPEVPKNHPAMGSMVMNFAANMLGLDNAATPLGLKAMGELQEINPDKDKASNAQIMFLVLNTSGLTLIPVSILALRATAGSVNPTDIFIPILIATFISSMVGLIFTAIVQKINLFDKVIVAYLGTGTLLIALLIGYLSMLSPSEMQVFSGLVTSILLFSVIVAFILVGFLKKVNIYESFIDGAKGGFEVAITIVPYLIAMLVAVGAFTASGAMELVVDFIRLAVTAMGFDTQFVDALPTAFMKPLSGGGARAMMVESWGENGSLVDTFTGKLTSVIQGSTETTFYVLAVYFGAVKIKNTRYAAVAGLVADFAGMIAAIAVAYFFFGN